jgi:hypothetical protein
VDPVIAAAIAVLLALCWAGTLTTVTHLHGRRSARRTPRHSPTVSELSVDADAPPVIDLGEGPEWSTLDDLQLSRLLRDAASS